MTEPSDQACRRLFESHPRGFEANRYVYPVVSRRSSGVSLGVNLNLDKACNFDCVYCQVDRTADGTLQPLDVDRLADELDETITLVNSGKIYEFPRFRDTPAALRRLNDLALSGDGEPTLSPDFGLAVDICADARRSHKLDDVKLVLITNATMLHLDSVQRALDVLDAANGQIWAKLDAGTEAYYRLVNRSAVPFDRVLDNLREAAAVRPIVIQSLFMQIDGAPPSTEEIEAYAERLRAITASGGRIATVQIHTIARPPAENWVAPLSNERLEAIASTVRLASGLQVETFGG